MNTPTNVEYDTDQTSAMNALLKNNKKNITGQGGIIGLLIRKGIVKNEKNANHLLVGFLVIVFLLTFYLLRQALKEPVLNPIKKVNIMKNPTVKPTVKPVTKSQINQKK